MKKSVPLPALLLGLAGLIPPAVLTAVAVLDLGLFAPSTPGFVRTYAAIILSFLGGTWWAFACKEERPRWPLLVVAVIPSLAAWWAIFTFQPAEGLFGLAILLLASLLVDGLLMRRRLAPPWWLKLRLPLSLGLALCCALSGWALVR
ncbi:hypothetical protein GCM10022280_20620 [Sphingomonas swuensis]|uniref:DUF3429 domain-containing protein n=1 Tax=Sphingomonas swuensis TaxID=977800 RepID=A0ABP7T301_9SPHN